MVSKDGRGKRPKQFDLCIVTLSSHTNTNINVEERKRKGTYSIVHDSVKQLMGMFLHLFCDYRGNVLVDVGSSLDLGRP